MSNTIDTAAAESLRTFAVSHGELAFAHLCTAALVGEEWAAERLHDAFARIGAQVFSEYRSRASEEIEAVAIDVIRATDTARPDGAIARAAFKP
jgi:hypothetical protein